MTTTIFGHLPDNKAKAGIISSSQQATLLGVRFPLFDKGGSANGIFMKTSGFSLILSELRQFIRTERGERVMLPNFGLSLRKYLFEPLTQDILSAIKEEIYFGVGRYLNKVNIRKLDIQEGDTISGIGTPGIKIVLLVSPRNSIQTSVLEIEL